MKLKHDLRQVLRPGRLVDFLNGKSTPYHFAGNLRTEVLDAELQLSPTILLDTGNGHQAVGKLFSRQKTEQSTRALEKLLDSARLHAPLAHPGIASFYALLDFPREGYSMILRKHVPGTSLQQQIADQHRLQPAVVAWMMHAALQAVEYLQLQPSPIVHGNLTPGNIMITPQGDIQLTDFTLAKIADSELCECQPMGNAQYRAPEQTIGDAQKTTDLWGIGVTAIEALLGTLPAKIPQLAGAELTPYQLPADLTVPTELRSLLEQMVLRDYDERPASASAVLDYLQEHQLVDTSPAVTPPSRSLWERIRPNSGKKRPRSAEEVGVQRHLRHARNYARMRSTPQMEQELDHARYLAGSSPHVEREASAVYGLRQEAERTYTQRLLRENITVPLNLLDDCPATQALREAVIHQAHTICTRNEAAYTTAIQSWVDSYIRSEVTHYVHDSLTTLRGLRHQISVTQIVPELARLKQIADSLALPWDESKALKLLR